MNSVAKNALCDKFVASERNSACLGAGLHIHPSHNVPGDTTAHERLDAALAEYKRRIAGV